MEAKKAKVETPAKVLCPKLKKKIHKLPESRREIQKQGERYCMTENAEISRARLGEKEKKRIMRLLLLRQVVSWREPAESKREGRELRAHH